MAQAAQLIALALDPSVETPEDEMSARILDAALELCAASGIRNLTMDDVAARARVGRMTVYRRFGTKDRLVESLSVREARRVLARLAGVLDPAAAPEERMAAGFAAAMRIAREHPMLQRLARSEPESVLAAIGGQDAQIIVLARAFLAEQIRAGQRDGEIPLSDADQAAEVLVRLGISFLFMQDTVVDLDDDEAARRFARTFIAPIVTRPGPAQ
jgi:AcrR family transcriptional regulator